jgi:hypothetical protein
MSERPTDTEQVQAELNACIATIKSMNGEITALHLLLAEAMQTIAILKATRPLPPLIDSTAPKRKRGRPRTVNDDSWMLEWFKETKTKFIAANKFKKPTDTAVITWSFEQSFLLHSIRISKARSPEFQAKLKRFKNRLGDVRNPIVKVPIK